MFFKFIWVMHVTKELFVSYTNFIICWKKIVLLRVTLLRRREFRPDGARFTTAVANFYKTSVISSTIFSRVFVDYPFGRIVSVRLRFVRVVRIIQCLTIWFNSLFCSYMKHVISYKHHLVAEIQWVYCSAVRWPSLNYYKLAFNRLKDNSIQYLVYCSTKTILHLLIESS